MRICFIIFFSKGDFRSDHNDSSRLQIQDSTFKSGPNADNRLITNSRFDFDTQFETQISN